MLDPADLLYAKVVPIEGITILEGCTPVLIPPKFKPHIIEFRSKIARQPDLFAADLLREFEIELRDLYLGIAEALLHPALPQVANTDGDPLEFHTLVYDLDSPREAPDALKDLAVGLPDEDIMRDAEFDGNGALVRAEILWRTRGNAKHAGWDHTSLGTVRIEGLRLTAEVNSAARARRLCKLIEQRLGSSARKRPSVVQSVQSLLDHEPTPAERAESRRRQAESARLAELPEVKAALGDMMRRHYRDWVDQKIPALRERTPREAVRDANGREAVEALIVQMERDGTQMRPALDPAIMHELRETLGLPQRE